MNTEYVQLIMMKIEDVSSSYLWVKYFMVVSNARLLEKMCLNNLFMEIDFTLRMLYRYFNSPLNVVETQGHKLYIRQSVL